MATYSTSQLNATGKYENLGWYPVGGGSRQYDAASGTFGEIGSIHPNSPQVGAGQRVSNEVVAQTNPNNVSYIDSQVKASQLQAPVTVPLTNNSTAGYVSGLAASVEAARKALNTNLVTRQKANDVQLTQVKQKEQQTLDAIGTLSTPFRADLETQQREALSINKNFQDNQKLVDELDTLLTEGNNLIKDQQSKTGIAAIRNPRIQKTMNDVAARAGVIQAVMAARNSQISVAENMIDRSINAISQDRQDQLSYYQTILQLNNQDKLALTEDNKLIAQQQVALLQGDLNQAQTTANFVKQMMLDPAKAQLLADSGVTLNDSVETISQKLAQGTYQQEVRDIANGFTTQGGKEVASPSGVPAKQLKSYVDSRGITHYYKMPAPAASTYTSSAAADSYLTTSAKPAQTGVSTTQTPITQVNPQTYSTIFSIAADVAGSGQGGSAKLR